MTAQEIDELFAQTLSGNIEDDLPWEAVRVLREIGSREIFDRASEWCESEMPLMRKRGADVLAQLGKTADHPSNKFPEDAYWVIVRLLQKEKDSIPLDSAICALGHIGNPMGVRLIVEHARHPIAEIRFSVAWALGNFPNDPLAGEALLELLQDTDDDVRDWATFGLGILGDADSNTIRDALHSRMSDSNEDVREEAQVGLSKRKDQRVLPSLIVMLEQPTMTDRVREAAQFMLGMDKDRTDWSGHDYAVALRDQYLI